MKRWLGVTDFGLQEGKLQSSSSQCSAEAQADMEPAPKRKRRRRHASVCPGAQEEAGHRNWFSRYSRVNPTVRQVIAAKFLLGKTAQQIAEDLKLDHGTVSYWVKKLCPVEYERRRELRDKERQRLRDRLRQLERTKPSYYERKPQAEVRRAHATLPILESGLRPLTKEELMGSRAPVKRRPLFEATQ